VHPTARTRFDLTEIMQCANVGSYRPEARRSHDDFKHLFASAAMMRPKRLELLATFRRKIGALGRVVKGAQQRKTRRERPAGVLQSLMVRAGGFTG
jgi:hypothetical protein